MPTSLASYFRGEVTKRFLLGICVPLAAVFFVLGNVIPAALFPGDFDWRYQAMSYLGSPSKNPSGHLVWSLGMTLSFLLGLPLCGYFRRRLELTNPRLAFLSSRVLLIGFLAGIIVGLETLIIPNMSEILRKGHEYLSIAVFVGLYMGVAGFWIALFRRFRRQHRRKGRGLFLLYLLPALPITGAMLSQAWLYFDPNRPGWVSPAWEELGIPLWLSFAFWEWLTAGGLVICLCMIAALLPAEPDPAGAGATD